MIPLGLEGVFVQPKGQISAGRPCMTGQIRLLGNVDSVSMVTASPNKGFNWLVKRMIVNKNNASQIKKNPITSNP